MQKFKQMTRRKCLPCQRFSLFVSLLLIQAYGGKIHSAFFSSTKPGSPRRVRNGEHQTMFQRKSEDDFVTDSQRRSSLMGLLTANPLFLPHLQHQQQANAIIDGGDLPSSQSITVPLKLVEGAYLLYFRVDGSLFRAVLDTGSPFLMIPGSCSENTRAKTGCYRSQGVPSGLDTTVELFDGFAGEVQWRKAPFLFVNATGSMLGPPVYIFGVVDDGIMSGPGGVFFGLIKNTATRIRPSFLGQTQVTSFAIDLRSQEEYSSRRMPDSLSSSNALPPSLTLSTVPLLQSLDYIPMNSDLRKKYGDPVQHYVAKADSICIDGIPLLPKNRAPIYVIFDTGVTGMVVSKELFDQRYMEARERRLKRLWGGIIEVSFLTKQNQMKSITAQKPLTTLFDPKVNWKNFNRHVVVVGLSFLDSKRLVVDIDEERIWIDD